MSTNPLRPNFNRANQIKSETGDVKQSITLFDIDYAMMSYLEDTVLPDLDDNGKAIKIPVIYGNSERWNGARRQGVYRDQKGKLQLPLMMLRRNTVAKDETMPFLRRGVYYQTISKYSKLIKLIRHGNIIKKHWWYQNYMENTIEFKMNVIYTYQ